MTKRPRQKPQNNLFNSKHLSNYTAPRYKKNEKSRISTLCRVSYHRKQSFPGDPQRICQNVACPEIFRCRNYYCIYMSAVCAGQYDCVEGDDGIYCPTSSCPGLLKCRREKRCVSKKELCDKHIDCLYSMDDETDCKIVYHAKGIILKSLQRQLFVHNLRFQGSVYLNASFCVIDKLLNLKSESMVHTNFINTDFQRNFYQVSY